MDFTAEMIVKAKKASSAEELLELAKAEGIAMTESEAAEYFKLLHTNGQLSDEELDQIAGGKGEKPTPQPKYHKGQHLWVGYPTTQNYLEIEVLWPEFYTASDGWRYYCRNEYGHEENYYLDTHRFVKTYKPKEWED